MHVLIFIKRKSNKVYCTIKCVNNKKKNENKFNLKFSIVKKKI